MKVFIGVRHEETDLSAVGHLVGGKKMLIWLKFWLVKSF